MFLKKVPKLSRAKDGEDKPTGKYLRRLSEEIVRLFPVQV